MLSQVKPTAKYNMLKPSINIRNVINNNIKIKSEQTIIKTKSPYIIVTMNTLSLQYLI
jgi:hypothetical protein